MAVEIHPKHLNPENDVNVSIQDQTTPIVDLYFYHEVGQITLASDVSQGDYTFTADTSIGTLAAGNVINFYEGNRFFQAEVVSIDTLTVTLDTPLDFAFTTACTITYGTYNMNVDGSSTPVSFKIPVTYISAVYDMTRVLGVIRDDSAMDDGKFGGITQLTNGVVLRHVENGVIHNIFNVKNNGELALRMFDANYIDSTLGPSGQYGYRFRRTFAGQHTNGVTKRLLENGYLEVLIQDDLTGLITFNMVGQGHVVE